MGVNRRHSNRLALFHFGSKPGLDPKGLDPKWNIHMGCWASHEGWKNLANSF
jgi:hypothetical protein